MQLILGIGSNLGNRLNNLKAAFREITNQINSIDLFSNIYKTSPVGHNEQRDFLNCVVCTNSTDSPEELLNTIKQIELAIGRKKTFRFGPRKIDIDILFYGEIKHRSKVLTIPHREIWNRAFVLCPLLDIISKNDKNNYNFITTKKYNIKAIKNRLRELRDKVELTYEYENNCKFIKKEKE